MFDMLKNLIRSTKFRLVIILSSTLLLFYIVSKFIIFLNTVSTDNAAVENYFSTISAEVNGKIQKVYCEDNQFVSFGQIIAAIDDSNYQVNFKKAELALAKINQQIEINEIEAKITQLNIHEAEAALKFTKIDLDTTTKEIGRIRELAKDDFSSRSLLEKKLAIFSKAEFELNKAQISLTKAKHSLELVNLKKSELISRKEELEQEKELAKIDLDRTLIRSPVDGVLSNSNLRIGNFVRPGIPLFSIVPKNGYYIKANFKETQIRKIKVGTAAVIKLDGFSDLKINGKVKSISSATGSKFSFIPTDNATGNFTKVVQRVPVLIELDVKSIPDDDVTQRLLPGMSAVVSIKGN